MQRKFYILVLMLLIQSPLIFGQSQTRLDIALRHIEQNAEKWNLTTSDYANLQISSEATSKSGITYVYLNQTHDNIPIRNAMMTLVINREGKVVSDMHNFVADAKSKVNKKAPTITAENAILQSANHLGVSVKGKPILKSRSDNGKLTFEIPELTKSSIPAELKYDMVDNKLVLVWNLNLDMKSSADYWDINIDATKGSFVSKANFTTYCQHHKDAFAKHDKCAINTFKNINKKTQRVSQVLANRAAATYNVYALPVESPNHGQRSLVSDDKYLAFSPFGWHDTDGADGAEFTITRGNNVYAYQDKDDDDDADGTPTEGGAALNFDFPIDLNQDSREFADAAVTNLFYMVNMMHDISASLGFTEQFGNFQQRNYSGAGDGQDYVLAQAFDGIELHEAGQTDPPKVNNANFSTPTDGFNGRMQMFFWENSGGAVSIDSPQSIEGFISEYGAASFGRVIPNATETAIIGNVAIAKDATTNPTLGCNAFTNVSEITGKIALIDRGVCEFGRKVLNAQNAGAIAALVCNISGVNGGNGEEILGMAAGVVGATVTIPSVFLKKSDCDKIRLAIANGETVQMTFQERERMGAEYLDGALDNGIIAHEFGHGISTRLTGGRLNSACLNNDEQMGEGWSDYFSLITTHEEGDKGSDARGIGTFAAAQQPTGSGIRRYPYSTDMTINPQTYDDIKGTTAPHPLGEVWTCMLWDMYWGFIDKYGVDLDWNNTESGNYKAAFLVIEGMKMQPCNPNFITGRDAILRADSIHFNKANQKIIWESFARRGLGYFADGGLTTDRNDGTENFDVLPTLIEKLKITKTATASVDAGGEIDVEINTINHIPSRQNNVIVTDELPNGVSYVAGSGSIEPEISGNVLTFSLGNLEYEQRNKITYKTKTNSTNKSTRLAFDNFDNDLTWDIQKNRGSEDWLPNYDIYRSPEVSWHVINVVNETDALLISTPFTITGTNPAMRFWHKYNTQSGFDGGFLEVIVDGGIPQVVDKSKFFRNAYNSEIAYATLAVPALSGFTGYSGEEWTDSYVDLSEYIGKTVSFQFRFATDATIAPDADFTGWIIDDFELLDIFKYSSQACISAEDGQGEETCTQAIETVINSDGTVSTEDSNNDYFGVTLTPNPAEDYVIISASSPYNVTANVEITNIDGRLIYTSLMKIDGKEERMTLRTNNLPGGVYLVKIQSGKNFSIKKLVIK